MAVALERGQPRKRTLMALALERGQPRKRKLMAVAFQRKWLLVVFRLAWVTSSPWAPLWGKSLAIGSGSVGGSSQSWTLDTGRC